MNEFWIKVIVNIIVGVIVVLGFFTFWGRSAGWFVEDGFVYEYFKARKEEKRKLREEKRESKK